MTRWIAIAFFFAHSATGLPSVGWVESASVFLPNGKTVEMEVKVDTGAQTSSLHATKVKTFTKEKEEWVRFSLNGQQVEAPLAKTAEVKSSDGDGERRYFVEVSVCLGSSKLHILVSLNDRSNMSYKALIGRHFLKHKFLVDSGKTFVLGKPACTP